MLFFPKRVFGAFEGAEVEVVTVNGLANGDDVATTGGNRTGALVVSGDEVLVLSSFDSNVWKSSLARRFHSLLKSNTNITKT